MDRTAWVAMTAPVHPYPPSLYRDEQGKGNCPLPLQPHPQKPPNPIGEGTTLKPDISLATKTGHFNLLRTLRRIGGRLGAAASAARREQARQGGLFESRDEFRRSQGTSGMGELAERGQISAGSPAAR